MVSKLSINALCGEPMMKILVVKEVFKRPNIDWDYDTDASHATEKTHSDYETSRNGNSPTSPNSPSQTVHDSEGNEVTYETFYLNKELLQLTSPYFAALDNFKEGSENVVVFRDVGAASFSIFADWVIAGKRDWRNPFCQDIDALVKAYALGRRLMVPDFQDFVMDEIQEFDTDGQINVQKYLSLQDLGFTQLDQITKYFIDRIAEQAVATDLWSFALPYSIRNEDGESVDQATALFMLPLVEGVIRAMQEKAFIVDDDYTGPKQNLASSKTDKRKLYHIAKRE